jgi:hypothetical protein
VSRGGQEGGVRSRRATQSGAYASGGPSHWIQVKKADQDHEDREPGRVVETGIGWLVVRFPDGSRRRYRNTSIPRLEELLARHGRDVVVQEPWRVLRIQQHTVIISRLERT